MSLVELGAAVAVAALSGGGLSAVVLKLLDRKADDVTTLRQIIAEVREDKTRDEARVALLEDRVRKLEERERHMLTRAAVHEAWDQLTWQALLAHVPDHPPPPPLRALGAAFDLDDPPRGRRRPRPPREDTDDE